MPGALNDYGKLIVLVVILVGVTALAAVNVVGSDACVAVYAAVLGYVTGNGVNAVRKEPPSPMLVPRLDETGTEAHREHPGNASVKRAQRQADAAADADRQAVTDDDPHPGDPARSGGVPFGTWPGQV